MSKEIVASEGLNKHVEYIEKNLALIQNQFQLSKDDLQNFAVQCKRTGLDPITRQIYAIPNNGKMTIMASIDGLRLIADRSGKYEGQTKAEWCGKDGKWVDVWLSKDLPSAARIGVYKSSFREPLMAVALFDEYAGRYAYDDKFGKYKKGDLTFMWHKMAALMIAKVAEALALRKAFPNEMSGIYSTEEMDQAAQPKAEPAQHAKDVSPKPQAAPISAPNPLSKNKDQDVGQFVITFGKHKGKSLESMDQFELANYLTWVVDSAKAQNKIMSEQVRDFCDHAEEFLIRSEQRKMSSDSIPF